MSLSFELAPSPDIGFRASILHCQLIVLTFTQCVSAGCRTLFLIMMSRVGLTQNGGCGPGWTA